MITVERWRQAQTWEGAWWGDCTNTLGEELKQVAYAKRMGLRMFHNGKSPYNIDLQGVSVADLGGGPVSMLLKCVNRGRSMVVDPLVVPKWVRTRYRAANIGLVQIPAEDFDPLGHGGQRYDEVWLYNVLQHTFDPGAVIAAAKRAGRLIRIFEWINTAVNEGHPFAFDRSYLDAMLGGRGAVETLQGEANCYGECYYGIFPTD